jgi:hypothetical protein
MATIGSKKQGGAVFASGSSGMTRSIILNGDVLIVPRAHVSRLMGEMRASHSTERELMGFRPLVRRCAALGYRNRSAISIDSAARLACRSRAWSTPSRTLHGRSSMATRSVSRAQ